MAQYKTVQVPRINIGHDSNEQDALKEFQGTIEKEASDGWELVCSHSIIVTQHPEPIGCFGQLLVLFRLKEVSRAITYNIDMLIFVKK